MISVCREREREREREKESDGVCVSVRKWEVWVSLPKFQNN